MTLHLRRKDGNLKNDWGHLERQIRSGIYHLHYCRDSDELEKISGADVDCGVRKFSKTCAYELWVSWLEIQNLGELSLPAEQQQSIKTFRLRYSHAAQSSPWVTFLFGCRRTACPARCRPWIVSGLSSRIPKPRCRTTARALARRSSRDPCRGRPGARWACGCPTRSLDRRSHRRRIRFPFYCWSKESSWRSPDGRLHAACCRPAADRFSCPKHSTGHLIVHSRGCWCPSGDTQCKSKDSSESAYTAVGWGSRSPKCTSWGTPRNSCAGSPYCSKWWPAWSRRPVTTRDD